MSSLFMMEGTSTSFVMLDFPNFKKLSSQKIFFLAIISNFINCVYYSGIGFNYVAIFSILPRLWYYVP